MLSKRVVTSATGKLWLTAPSLGRNINLIWMECSRVFLKRNSIWCLPEKENNEWSVKSKKRLQKDFLTIDVHIVLNQCADALHTFGVVNVILCAFGLILRVSNCGGRFHWVVQLFIHFKFIQMNTTSSVYFWIIEQTVDVIRKSLIFKCFQGQRRCAKKRKSHLWVGYNNHTKNKQSTHKNNHPKTITQKQSHKKNTTKTIAQKQKVACL